MKKRRNNKYRRIRRRFFTASMIMLYAVCVIAHFAINATGNTPVVFSEPQETTAEKLPVIELVHRVPATRATEPEELSRYAGIVLSDDDIDLLAKIIWLEARGEEFEGQQAVAEVVLNRILSDDFPDTLSEVIYERHDGVDQFSTACLVHTAKPGSVQYAAIESALSGSNILPVDVVFFSQGPQNDNIWGTIGGHVFCYPWYWEG